MKAEIIVENTPGYHNTNKETLERLERAKSYKDLSTICLIPSKNGLVHLRCVMAWNNLMKPMNQKFTIIPVIGLEVGDAYTQAIEMILASPDLSQWKYILTLEHDNMPPPDGLLKLYETIETFDVVGGLYWTKGECGQPMIYGNPQVMPKNFVPQLPIFDAVQEANGLGMGFNLFRLDIFKNPDLPKPFFKTVQEHIPQQGSKAYTQDLYFYENAAKLGYRFASDNRVKVGHFDLDSGVVW